VKELPDPFTFQNGSRVKSKRDWGRRRSELLGLILRYEYGSLPPESESVTGMEVSSRSIAGPGAVEKQILLTMGPAGSVHTHLLLSIPAGKGPFPAIVKGDLCWGRVDPLIIAEANRRGYIVAEFDRTEI